MLTGSLLNYVGYFEQWAEADEEVKFFLFGSVEKGIEVARGHPKFDYPFAWLEEPGIVTDDNGAGHLNEIYQGGLCILIYAPPDDYDAQLVAQDTALKILYRLQQKLRADNRKGTLQCELRGMKKEPISQLWVDNHRGWRLQFDCVMNLNAYLGNPPRS